MTPLKSTLEKRVADPLHDALLLDPMWKSYAALLVKFGSTVIEPVNPYSAPIAVAPTNTLAVPVIQLASHAVVRSIDAM